MTLEQAFFRFLKYNNILHLFKVNKKYEVNYAKIKCVYFIDESFSIDDIKYQPYIGFWRQVDDAWCDLLYDLDIDEEYGDYKFKRYDIRDFKQRLKSYKIYDNI